MPLGANNAPKSGYYWFEHGKFLTDTSNFIVAAMRSKLILFSTGTVKVSANPDLQAAIIFLQTGACGLSKTFSKSVISRTHVLNVIFSPSSLTGSRWLPANILTQIFDFFVKKFDLCQKFRFLSKISIFVKNFDFC